MQPTITRLEELLDAKPTLEEVSKIEAYRTDLCDLLAKEGPDQVKEFLEGLDRTLAGTLLHRAIFAEKALEPAPEGEVFWYTSGMFGPFYINTHFLAGGATKAKAILQGLDGLEGTDKDGQKDILAAFMEAIRALYHEDEVYRLVIHCLAQEALAQKKQADYTLISGGARRDYFFSFLVGVLLDLPQLFILKDQSVLLWHREAWLPMADLEGMVHQEGVQGPVQALHVADLITQASSFFRAWIPALKDQGIEMKQALAVVDRHQGGLDKLAEAGVDAKVLLQVNQAFFDQAVAGGQMSAGQAALSLTFLEDPVAYERDFLRLHPSYLKEAKERDAKTKERVERFLQDYGASVGLVL